MTDSLIPVQMQRKKATGKRVRYPNPLLDFIYQIVAAKVLVKIHRTYWLHLVLSLNRRSVQCLSGII